MLDNIKLIPTIIWEKWADPYGQNIEDIEWPGFNKNNIVQDDIVEDAEITELYNKPLKVNAMITNMGVIPYNEYTDCTKIFNFWIGHTNFTITKFVSEILENIEGVETLDIFTRYRFRVSFGKAFNERTIISNINTIITDKIKI